MSYHDMHVGETHISALNAAAAANKEICDQSLQFTPLLCHAERREKVAFGFLTQVYWSGRMTSLTQRRCLSVPAGRDHRKGGGDDSTPGRKSWLDID